MDNNHNLTCIGGLDACLIEEGHKTHWSLLLHDTIEQVTPASAVAVVQADIPATICEVFPVFVIICFSHNYLLVCGLDHNDSRTLLRTP